MDDSPDRIGPNVDRKRSFPDKIRGLIRAFTTK